MEKFLSKRWHGIPGGLIAGFLALLLVVGATAAGYTFLNQRVDVEVHEPMAVQYSLDGGVNWLVPTGTPITVVCYAGESMLVKVKVTNNASTTINVTADFVDSTWTPVTWATVTGLPSGAVSPGSWIYDVTATVNSDAPSGNYTGYVVFERG